MNFTLFSRVAILWLFLKIGQVYLLAIPGVWWDF